MEHDEMNVSSQADEANVTPLRSVPKADRAADLDAALANKLRDKLREAADIDRARSDRELHRQAEGLAEVLRLEISGVRDGNGCWLGSDPVEYHIQAMEHALQQYRQRTATFRDLTPPYSDQDAPF